MVPFSPFPFMFLFVLVFYHVTVWMGSNKLNWTELNLSIQPYRYLSPSGLPAIRRNIGNSIRRRSQSQYELTTAL